MSTNGVYGFYVNGIDKIALKHYDAYPDGLGSQVVNFIRATFFHQLQEIGESITVVDGDSHPTMKEFKKVRPWIATWSNERSTPSVTINYVWNDLLNWGRKVNLEDYRIGGLKYMIDEKEFLQHSLHCEWGYIINLDEQILEIYRGFQKQPQVNRFFIDNTTNGYYNCHLIEEMPLLEIVAFNDKQEIHQWLEYLKQLAEERSDKMKEIV